MYNREPRFRILTTPTKASGLLAFLLLSIPGCSLIVGALEKDPADSQASDAGGADAVPGSDASPLAICGPDLSNTLAYFSAEGDQGRQSLHDSVTDSDLGESLLENNNQFMGIALEVASGPAGCGNAFDLSQEENRLFRVQHSRLPGVMSVDLWVRVDANPIRSKMVVLGKDKLQIHDGDLQLSVFNTGADSHVIMRMQSLAPEQGTAYWCSPQITRDEWHHVAVSFDGSDARLFVDGQTAAAEVNISGDYPDSMGCNQSSGSAKTAMPSANDNDWLVGASNSTSPNNTATDFFVGAVDELRFRSSGFTQAEAEQVYGQGR